MKVDTSHHYKHVVPPISLPQPPTQVATSILTPSVPVPQPEEEVVTDYIDRTSSKVAINSNTADSRDNKVAENRENSHEKENTNGTNTNGNGSATPMVAVKEEKVVEVKPKIIPAPVVRPSQGSYYIARFDVPK